MKRGPKPCLVESPLTTWMDESGDQMVCPTLTEIKDEAQAMAEKKTSVQNPALRTFFFCKKVEKCLFLLQSCKCTAFLCPGSLRPFVKQLRATSYGAF